MTPLDWLNALMTLPALLLSAGWLVFPILVVIVGVYAVVRYIVWPYLCDFGNWLGRE